jgi:hypothetical protein
MNTEYASFYEDASMLISFWEEKAIVMRDRNGPLSVTEGPLLNSLTIVDSLERSLQPPSSQGRISVEFDEDIAELVGGDSEGWAARYLEECLNCDLRFSFDWQLRPIRFMPMIRAMLEKLRGFVRGIRDLINPFRILEGFCNLLNGFRGFCIQDIIAILMSLKMLIRRYTQNALSFRLDWTIVFGPILKVVIGGIVSLIDNVFGLIVAPLDCAMAALNTANQVERNGRQLLNELNQTLDGLKLSSSLEIQNTKFTWEGSSSGDYPTAPDPGGLVRANDVEDPSGLILNENLNLSGITLPTTVDWRLLGRLEEAITKPEWVNTTAIEKLLLPLREAISFIKDLESKLSQSLQSLDKLIGEGFGGQLKNLGVLIFLADMISAVMLLIRLLRGNPNEDDWCTTLRQNPRVLEDMINSRVNSSSGIIVTNVNDDLVLTQQGREVGIVKTCGKRETAIPRAELESWFRELRSMA